MVLGVERMEIGFGGMDGGVQGAVKTLDSHFAKADALLQVSLVCSRLKFELGEENLLWFAHGRDVVAFQLSAVAFCGAAY